MEPAPLEEARHSRLRNSDDHWRNGGGLYDDLSDLPSDEINDSGAVMRRSSSIASIESYASSIMQLSERRASILSSVMSTVSPSSEDVYSNKELGRSVSPLEGVDFSGGLPIQTSLPETAALARLTCQQVDEMMSLVLAMIRRLDQLDERVTALVPPEHHHSDQRQPEPTSPTKTSFDLSSPYTWVKGALVVAFPFVLAAALSYLRPGKVHKKHIRRG
ncbi:hypothetical protein L0F63_001732 [Massospora cicadina]|nr:hypothetical protein L0F63_001732 [Massospora cicadina]